ncbi:MAG: cell division protein ZapA [Schleiferiaceae bacterium]|nr:cell division protein ZapA [Schleiferiaceae bacterium]
MDPHLKIKVNIADRVYPLTIKREEEEMIRRAVKMINDTVKSFQEKYAVKDKQDVLAMCALQWASQLEKLKAHDKQEMVQVNDALEEFNTLLKAAL